MTRTVVPERLALRHATKVRAAAMQFWTALGLDASATRKRLPLELVHTVHTHCQSQRFARASVAVSRDQYGFVHSRLSKALAPDLTDADALLAAEDDWRDDTGAKGANETGRMKFDAYAESLFGLADMWAAPSEEAYLEFLQKTYHSITRPTGKMKPTRRLGSCVRACCVHACMPLARYSLLCACYVQDA